MDGGAEKPLGMGYGSMGGPRRPRTPAGASGIPPVPGGPVDVNAMPGDVKQSVAELRDIVSLLGAIGADTVSAGGGGAGFEPPGAGGGCGAGSRGGGAARVRWPAQRAGAAGREDPGGRRRD